MQRPILLCLMALLYSFFSHAQITSTFNSTNDGWTFFNGATGGQVPGVFNSTGGNPSGYTSITYPSNTGIAVQSWIAPAPYLGNHVVKSVGMNFRFDLQQSVVGTNSNTNGDVRLENGGTAIVFSLPAKPSVAPAWSSYSLRLDETQGWRMNTTTGALATRAQIVAVLANITAIEIRGTYVTNATYTSGLDNVILEERLLPTAPSITTFSPTTGKPGSSVVINGYGFDAAPSNNVIYFGTVRASVVSASATQLTVAVPAGSTSGPITVVNKITGLQGKSRQAFTPTFDGGGRIIPSSFRPRVDINLSIGIEGFAAGDLDGDGWVDLAVANNEQDAIDIYRNLGLGGNLSAASFAPKFTITMAGTSTNGAGLRIMDVDSDGQLDIISSTGTSAFTSAFATFRNISTPGNLAFEAQENWAGNSDETPIYFIGDIDGDGKPEMIGGEGSSGAGANLWIIQNISSAGNIEFASSLSFFSATVDAIASVSSGDLDNDGKPELLVSHGFGDKFSIIKNSSTPGTLSLTDIGQIATGQYNYGLQATDVDGDGKNDIVYKRSADDIHIRLNTNDGITALATSDFSTDIILPSDLGNYGGMSIGDINGDGKPDMIATDDGDVGIFENVFGNAPLTASSFIPAYLFPGAGNSTYPTSPLAADLNGDGKPEVIMGVTNTTPNRISIFENKNVVAPSISVNTVSPLKGLIGSLVTITGDNFSTVPAQNTVLFGSVKAVVVSASKTSLTVEVPVGATYGYVSVTRDELTSRYHLPFDVIFSPGRTIDATSFGAPVNFTLTGADFDIDAGDINGDGKVDVLVEASNFGYAFRNVHTSGVITTASLVNDGPTGSNAQNPKLIDIDSDGKLDIASVNGIYRNITSTATIAFDPLVNAGGTTNIGIADFNRDGRIDWAGGTTGPVQFYENRSRSGAFATGAYGTVSPLFTIPTSGSPVAVATADFDNDGFQDIAAAVTASIDYISFFRNVGQSKLSASSFVSGQNINTLDLPGRVYEGDLDVDGKMDIVVYYQAAGLNGNMFSVFHNQSSGPGNVNFVQHDYTIGAITGAAGTVCGPSTIADIDGDGKPEIIITSASTTAARQGFYVFKNNSTPGTIDASSFVSSGLIPLATTRAVAAADLNGDGKTDLIFTRTNLVSIVENILTGVPVTITTQPGSNSICEGGTIVLGVAASGDPSLQYQWQQQVGATFIDLTDDPTHSGTSTATMTLTNLTTTATYRVRVSGTFAIVISNTATITVNPVPAAPATTGNSGCAGTSVTLNASGSSNGNYRWYSVASGGTAIAGAVNDSFTTSALSLTTNYYVAITNGTCESARVPAIATITTVSPPTGATGASRCDAGTVTLTASGGSNGNYRWYSSSSGGTAFPGEVNASFTTPSLSSTSTFFVSVVNGACESATIPVTATVNTPPAKPIITSSIVPSSGVVTICNGSITLSATPGFTYTWSNGATTQQISASTAAVYTVQVTDGNSCTSVVSDGIQVVIDGKACNTPPIIDAQPLTTSISGNVSLTLSDIITDAENNFSNVVIISQPSSGAIVTISNGVLTIDYSNTSFSGTDQFVLKACDIQNLCSENVTISIEVVGEIEIFNAVSPNGDGLNEFLLLQYIEVLERTRNNKVTILNRWGDRVFEVSNYDNATRVFKGLNSSGTELPSGTYFYKIEFTGPNAPPMKTGYFALKR